MIRIGTRGSALAQWQASWVAQRLKEQGNDIRIVEIRTAGDVSGEPIREFGGEGVFTKELQATLLQGKIDVAVHSLKDLPTEIIPDLLLASVPQRGPYRDAFLSSFTSWESLPAGSKIGTGSMRRKTQILHKFGDRFQIVDIRGNVPTRLRFLQKKRYDAIILAQAGLVRLGLQEQITALLDPPDFLPAVGQGAIGIEIRNNDSKILRAVQSLNDRDTFAAVMAERAMLRTIRGGCLAPIGALGSVENDWLTLHARVLSHDGQTMIESQKSAPLADATTLGEQVALSLLEQGADALIQESRFGVVQNNNQR